jgi:hypothetical protein
MMSSDDHVLCLRCADDIAPGDAHFAHAGDRFCIACAPTWNELSAWVAANPRAAWTWLGIYGAPARRAFLQVCAMKGDAIVASAGASLLAQAARAAEPCAQWRPARPPLSPMVLEIIAAAPEPLRVCDIAARLPAIEPLRIQRAVGNLAARRRIEEAWRCGADRTWRAVAPHTDHHEGRPA